jgi:hypothetical protein
MAFLFGLTVGWFLGIASVFAVVAYVYRRGVVG